MPLNVPGLLVPLQLLWYPRVIVPSLIVKARLSGTEKAGYRGAIFDKDNCLTLPHKDELVPELKTAWQECRETFGEGNVIIVSNSAGTHLDAGGIQAESVSYHLDVPVLIHTTMKPSYSCIAAIRKYHSSLPSPVEDKELIIVGDRLFTDVVLANRIRSWKGWRSFLGLDREPPSAKGGPLAVWTTGVWQKEATVLRWSEKQMLALVQRWSRPGIETQLDTGAFIRKPPKEENTTKDAGLGNIFTKLVWSSKRSSIPSSSGGINPAVSLVSTAQT
ncbi:mitochondrial PGP phosphatase-domain-containing protein [Desarmillaria tabescens]|uniref:Mitochondrial PGP phosphatase-domain-containing protein n=1 Tax=Armillaria tabescens TaxID=1929756 RepID=A0AA39N6C8_ARMTA|nr:mitochondrial PGP phosphatase-domain-containing protein [Desarmillaria tabescens]KAK0459093.1 mitochondrial PGP phosphatase-domain-containing protein [Desarmillaria tabescens]